MMAKKKMISRSWHSCSPASLTQLLLHYIYIPLPHLSSLLLLISSSTLPVYDLFWEEPVSVYPFVLSKSCLTKRVKFCTKCKSANVKSAKMIICNNRCRRSMCSVFVIVFVSLFFVCDAFGEYSTTLPSILSHDLENYHDLRSLRCSVNYFLLLSHVTQLCLTLFLPLFFLFFHKLLSQKFLVWRSVGNPVIVCQPKRKGHACSPMSASDSEGKD